MTFERSLRQVLAELGVGATDAQITRLLEHYSLLVRWNERTNLTRVTEPVAAARRHYGEAAFLHRELPDAESIVDVGSGAGFPGLPVAILRPGTAMSLVESTQKKAAFLREVTNGMANVDVFDGRICAWTGSADWAVMRAVNSARVLPDLSDKVKRVAILGTERPPENNFGGWQERKLPWSDRGRLWLSAAESSAADRVSRETAR